jgi:hypothetical protein
MQIYISRPGGQREGPFTPEQINRDLASRKYHDTDYWAWYEGLEAWVPLHSVPGIKPLRPLTGPGTEAAAAQEKEAAPIPVEPRSPRKGPAGSVSQSPGVEPEAAPAAGAPQEQLSSGLPFQALDHMFIFTSGDGPAIMRSPLTGALLQQVIGQEIPAIRDKIPRDVFGKCDIAERLRRDGSVPSAAWRAMSALKPDLVQKARDGAYRVCVRTFSIETNEVAAIFLFYNKQKL